MMQHHYPEAKKPSRVVLLGGSGFIGKTMAGHLTQSGIPFLSLSSADVDLCSSAAPEALSKHIEKNDALVILSAVTPDKGRDSRMQMKNLIMGQALCDFLEKKPCSHVIYFSSDAVYNDDLSLVNESSPASPSSFYGIMHFGRERMLADVLKKNGTPFLVLRPSILYGQGDTHNSYGPNRFFRTAISEQKIKLFGKGEEKRDHVFVHDVCRLLLSCLERQSHGILNVATGRSVSFMEIAMVLQKLFEGKITIETTPRANPITYRHYDIEGLLKAFPDFHFTELEAGLKETFKAMHQLS